jgi:hypothetical protein
MNGGLISVLLVSLLAPGVGPASAQVADKAKEAERIERECGVRKGTITINGDRLRLRLSPDEAYDRVDCALERLRKADLGKLGFVGNEVDQNAVLRPPLRYVAAGSKVQIAALVNAAKADKWTVTRTATAPEGTVIVLFESGAATTHGEASKLLDRIWKLEFGDIAFGLAPRKLSDSDSFDD